MEDLERNLTEDQLAAVKSDARRLRILAGAGTGKTRVLTHRIAYQTRALRLDPNHALCLTFSKRAASELQDRLAGLNLANTVTAGTFHAVALAQIRARWSDLRVKNEPNLLTNREKFLFALLPKSFSAEESLFVLNEINWATAQRVSAEQYPEIAEASKRKATVERAIVSESYRKFTETKRRRNVIDFDDILELAIQLLSEDTGYTEARHWKFQDLFVDEFQDVNPLQFALLRSWIGTNSSLCVVGDSNQAIYAWNGADSSYLNNFSQYFPNAESLSLRQSFRSSPEILSAASLVLPNKADLISNRPHGPLPTIRSEADENAEAMSIAQRVLSANSNTITWADQAVLVRTHGQIAPIAHVFEENNIPFRTDSDSLTVEGRGSSNGVRLLTFHGSKGLEWKVVHLAGVEEGLTPIAHASTEKEKDEEKRLMYVAMTRAADELHLSWARRRNYGKSINRKASSFLYLISSVSSGPQIPKEPLTGKTLAAKIAAFRLRRTRKDTVIIDANYANSTIEQLKELRSSIAKVNDVPPESIFSDEMLEKLVTEAPESLDHLQSMHGLSPVVVSRFGEQILELVAQE